eukprot:TRINITY_DN14890_c0_g1_i1.p1 TRINITY_DN14890_c0_g1~~TRINITY_DN14890_c0_g1_i1.p1  ORF type:complete len:554 (-),score=144.69 TRINITY_DN14890_c0_g1_i1:108-1769(-)
MADQDQLAREEDRILRSMQRSKNVASSNTAAYKFQQQQDLKKEQDLKQQQLQTRGTSAPSTSQPEAVTIASRHVEAEARHQTKAVGSPFEESDQTVAKKEEERLERQLGKQEPPSKTVRRVAVEVPLEELSGPTVPTTLSVAGSYENKILQEINFARTDPLAYAQSLKELVPLFQGLYFKVPGTNLKRKTEEGSAAVQDAIEFLSTKREVPPLQLNVTLSEASAELVQRSGGTGETGSVLSDGTTPVDRVNSHGSWAGNLFEVLSYGAPSAQDAVQQWIIDDGQPQRDNRDALFSTDFSVAGIASGPHSLYNNMISAILVHQFREKTANSQSHNSLQPVSAPVLRDVADGGYYEVELPVKSGLKKERLQLKKAGRRLGVLADGELVEKLDLPFDLDTSMISAQFFAEPPHLRLRLFKEANEDKAVNHSKIVTSFVIPASSSAHDDQLPLDVTQNNDEIRFRCGSIKYPQDLVVKIEDDSTLVFESTFEVPEVVDGEDVLRKTTQSQSLNLPFAPPLNDFFVDGLVDGFLLLRLQKPTQSSSTSHREEEDIFIN